MKNFIKVTTSNGNMLINTNHIVMVDEIVFDNGKVYCDINLSVIGYTLSQDLPNEGNIPTRDFNSYPQKVQVSLSLAEIQNMIEESLL